MKDEELAILYRKALKFITYIPAQGYLWIDYDGEWHGLYELERQAVADFFIYLLATDLTGRDDLN
ncbi:hypothetical protein PHIN3_255 [Sinorhizobium phage phiN3]|uniref:Uncharacterized protein n=1 Tax=Sinorhizobium phage phiN3 TaxID=1647405 RepID=A0A0F6SJ36_9CAUD|nr:hypothetical protein AVT40_gp278 [Sinorhizobium phage phiN3]AKF13518.1 hypothetical protein PHIN3_255 [Sinorhizobium phage phiN3]